MAADPAICCVPLRAPRRCSNGASGFVDRCAQQRASFTIATALSRGPVVTARDLDNKAATEVRGSEKATGALAESRRNPSAIDPPYFIFVLWFRACDRLRRCRRSP
jgi:hypothetical protein